MTNPGEELSVNELILVRALKDCLIVMAQADAGDTLAAELGRRALAAVGEREEKAVIDFGLCTVSRPHHSAQK